MDALTLAGTGGGAGMGMLFRCGTLSVFLGVLLPGALPAVAGPVLIGIATDDCQTPVDPSAGAPGDQAELLAFKVPASGDCTDILFDLRAKGGRVAGGADGSGTLWGVAPNWRSWTAANDTRVIILVYPPSLPNGGTRFAIDSETTGTFDFGINIRQTLGNSIPSSFAATGLAGIDLTLPQGSATYGVKLAGSASSATANFPQRAGAGGMLEGIEVAFAPLIEVNNVDWTGNGCSVAGRSANQATTSPPGNDGIIIGYNMYRVAGMAGSVPTPRDFFDASLDADPETGWQYFLPMTTGFALNVPDQPAPAAAGTISSIDAIPNDLGGLQNPDGVLGTGDEVLLFQDSLWNRSQRRDTGVAPLQTASYWYAVQPVLCGTVAALADVSFGLGQFGGDHATSVSALSAADDAIDLDRDGSIEFFSPQADMGLPGLGLTLDSLPALSAPVFADAGRALAATGDITLVGALRGPDVDLTVQVGLQEVDVVGFNVYRGVGVTGVRVNDQPILTEAAETLVIGLVDDASDARRHAKAGSLEYTVEILHADGTTSAVGPFSVAGERRGLNRRSR